jgi:hypothetical protein
MHAGLAPSEWQLYLKSLEKQIIDATVQTPDRAATTEQWDQGYADVGRSFGADAKIVRDAVAAHHSDVVTSIELGNEPQSEWALPKPYAFPGTDIGRDDMIAQFMETTKAAMAVVGHSPGAVVLDAPAQWDPATEAALLDAVVASEKNSHQAADLVPRIAASPFHHRLDQYIAYWKAQNPEQHTMPLAIHMYNSPALDVALMKVLSDLAGRYKLQLALYVTEFQVDADAGAGAGIAGQTKGLLAAGIHTELAKHSNLTIVSMVAWSYTEVKKPGKDYDLHNNPSLDGEVVVGVRLAGADAIDDVALDGAAIPVLVADADANDVAVILDIAEQDRGVTFVVIACGEECRDRGAPREAREYVGALAPVGRDDV